MNHFKFLSALLTLLAFAPKMSLAMTPKPARVDRFNSIREADFSKFSRKLQIKFHERLTQALVEFERKEKYPEYTPSRYSSIDFLKFFQEVLVSKCIASENGNLCLFGGWPSVRNGSCTRPWSSSAKAASESLGVPSYDSGAYCGDEKLFRCNPLLFGPGIEDGAVTVEFPNVNGKKNNAEPWHSGICVDISDGYNGLSEKCQKASTRLDEIRVTTGRPKWRSSDFFDENKAKSLKALQELVYSKCNENFEKLNQDNMCTSLNDSIALTTTAALAGEIKGITPDMINGNCSVAQAQALPQCNQDVHNDFKPLIEAMEELRTQRNCRFLGIQALGDKNVNNNQTLPSENCRSVIIGDAAARGFIGLNPEKFKFNIMGSGNQKLGTLDAYITKGMTKEAIMARLTNFDNKAKFEQFCNVSACPKSEDESLKNLYSAIEQVKGKEHCKIGKIQVMNPEFADSNSSQCTVSIEGNLGSEGLTKERAPASVQVYDTEGKVISTLEIKVSSEMKTEDIVAQFDNEELRKICVEANTAHLIDDTVAAQEVGLPDSTFVPSYWKDKMNLLRNAAINNDIKGFRVEIDSTGSLKLFADDPLEILRYQTEISNILNAGRRDGGHLTYLNLGDRILVSGEPPSVRIEAIANREKVTLSAPQNGLLEEFASASTLLDFKVDDNGQLSLLSGNLDMSDKALLGSGEEFLDFKVVSVERDPTITSMPSFRYVLAPK